MENTQDNANNEQGQTRINVELQSQDTLFKSFATEEEFNAHSAGIRKGAEKTAQKQLLSQLGVESIDELQERLNSGNTEQKPAANTSKDTSNNQNTELMDKISQLEESNRVLAESLLKDKLNTQLHALGVKPEARSYIVNDIVSQKEANAIASDSSTLKEYLANHPLGAIAVDSREPAIKKQRTRTISEADARGINSFFAR